MELIKPGIGLLFWMTLSFSIVLFILAKYAWKPILKSLKDRDNSIAEALNAAEKARTEIDQLKSDNEKIMQEARNERDKLLAEAREIKDSIVNDAKDKAKAEATKLLAQAIYPGDTASKLNPWLPEAPWYADARAEYANKFETA